MRVLQMWRWLVHQVRCALGVDCLHTEINELRAALGTSEARLNELRWDCKQQRNAYVQLAKDVYNQLETVRKPTVRKAARGSKRTTRSKGK